MGKPKIIPHISADARRLSQHEWNQVVDFLALAPQQAKIVELIFQGKRDKQIAEILHLRLPTIRTHLRHLFARLNVADRIELVLLIFAIVRQMPRSNGSDAND